jgi:hypothetical protein
VTKRVDGDALNQRIIAKNLDDADGRCHARAT